MFKYNLRGKVHRDVERQLTLIIDKAESLKKAVEPLIAANTQPTGNEGSLVESFATPLIGTGYIDPILASLGTGSGSVTSVGVSGDSNIQVSGSPITTSGTIAVTLGPNITGDSIDVTTNYKVAGEQVLSASVAGWEQFAGGINRDNSALATSTATTEEVAEALNALIRDLKNHGLLKS